MSQSPSFQKRMFNQLLQHVDNPIAENAITIHLDSNGEMTMTPMLACYMKTPNSTRWQSLTIGREIFVQTGDKFSLIPDRSWFKIISTESNEMEDDDAHGKRKAMNPLDEEPPDKKIRSEASTETIYSQSQSVLHVWDNDEDDCELNCGEKSENSEDPSALIDTNSTSPNGNQSVEVIPVVNDGSIAENTDAPNTAGCSSTPQENSNNPPTESPESKDNSSRNNDETGKKIKWDCGRHFSDQPDQRTEEVAQETGETSATTEENRGTTAEATVASDDPPRNKCTYGSQCYRRNSEHRAMFSHPGDPDYDIPDDRPECPYGVRCYRKNPQHRRDFKHTSNRRNRAQTPVRGPTPSATSETEQSSADESVDESDYEPSLVTSDDDETDCDRSDYDRSDYDATSDPDDKLP